METVEERALEHWGVKEQLCKLMEECGELVRAANKYRMRPDNERLNHFIDELVDVTIMIGQMRTLPYTIRPIDIRIGEVIDARVHQKREELSKRLDDAERGREEENKQMGCD